VNNQRPEPIADDSWRQKPLEQLAREQGITPLGRLEDVWGRGSGLWTDEEDFEAFLEATEGVQIGGREYHACENHSQRIQVPY
jgi:hypothetical protein